MARAQATDYLHSMRFMVVATSVSGAANKDWLGSGADVPQAGFMNCSTPDINVEPVEYREGHWIYAKKQPGIVNMGGDLSLSRGVTKGDSTFWHWIRNVIEGNTDYRADLDINHYHRSVCLPRPHDDLGKNENQLAINTNSAPARMYHVRDAFPIYHKVAGDLDANSGEISIMDLTVTYERFEVEESTVF
jgi:phage tail-like protein